MCVERFRKLFGNAGDADIPSNMSLHLAGGKSEVAKRARNEASVMIADQQKRRASSGIFFEYRRNICRSQE